MTATQIPAVSEAPATPGRRVSGARRGLLRIVAAIAFSGIAVTALAGTASAAAPTPPPPYFTRCTYGNSPQAIAAGIAHDSQEQRLANLINNYRVQHGVPALRAVTSLQEPAYWDSVDSAFRGVSDPNYHDSLGRYATQRVQECGGYTGTLAESNYWADGGGFYPTADGAMSAWINSPSDNGKLLSRAYTTFGIGRAYFGLNAERQHWTVVFGDH